jgi:hypothetical protein
MTTLQVTISDQLAAEARRAGLLTPEALSEMLRDRLRTQAGNTLREMGQHQQSDDISDEQMQEIVAEVKAARAARHAG